MPEGSGDTEQWSLWTVLSVSTVTERDLGHDSDMLADELRTYDHVRGMENQDVIDNVRAFLRQELQDLTDSSSEHRLHQLLWFELNSRRHSNSMPYCTHC
jgi:hypothetical protein